MFSTFSIKKIKNIYNYFVNIFDFSYNYLERKYMLEKLLKTKKCFKLVLGAGNEDIKSIEKLMRIYYEAGCRFFDICMNEDAAKIAKETCPDAMFCFSYGIKDDPHTIKAQINPSRCSGCMCCEDICIQNAIKNGYIDESKCVGCRQCLSVCHNNAIQTYSKTKDLKEVLPKILPYNPQCIELHATSDNENEVDRNWNYISRNYTGIMSLCIDRSILGDKGIIERIKKLIENRKPYSTIIQADGNPMSGGKDDYKTTLQAVAMAEVIQKNNLPVYLLLSGGTNSKTKELANLCEIDINGISIGSYARKIVKPYIEQEKFSEKEELFNKAVEIAKDLIKSTYI